MCIFITWVAKLHKEHNLKKYTFCFIPNLVNFLMMLIIFWACPLAAQGIRPK
ncbi:MAG: ADP-dependent glucokinase/phosphofructokinase [Bacteroidia bacterium]|nr:ADP-dependent glucokinase/phosphofructokinase [Bacteroidia bacterium]MDW8346433.1 hypothetical protein [Bacteroidia bacterium]